MVRLRTRKPTTEGAERLCVRCGERKEHSDRAGRRGSPRAWCDDCHRAYLKEWRAKNWQRRKARDTWKNMIARCSDRSRDRYVNAPRVPLFSNYGAIGIRVCRRWSGAAEGFANFVADVGLPPSPEHTLDRKDPRRNYTPGNCRWVDRKTQNENRKNTRWVFARNPTTGESEMRCLSDWQRVTGIDRRTIATRLNRGWDADRAVATGFLAPAPF